MIARTPLMVFTHPLLSEDSCTPCGIEDADGIGQLPAGASVGESGHVGEQPGVKGLPAAWHWHRPVS
ncbi:hypothetical protein NKJ71_26160 [Mesorhizobium sp. M0050]|uniref:hypothetical protein n=1 Tax=Mesorhizobium sp. M0050 TaxID=2956861 RepID=UPI0033357D0A